ncbi:MAG: AbrB/MazE/SpoVT family DNA-binding domain-containing protein [Nitrospiraceae bacterium]|jgi:AbrB family looped-hinge helix DNA binding protein|nr:AbrB/MazE/SpoVT family DNA-binding domain-containing protein [Nitrospiraceae bacterium]
METVIIGERGQVTIPKKLREKLGIKPKSPVVIELKENGILIKPAVTVPLREFSDEFVKQLEKEDMLKKGEKEGILSKWKKK